MNAFFEFYENFKLAGMKSKITYETWKRKIMPKILLKKLSFSEKFYKLDLGEIFGTDLGYYMTETESFWYSIGI